MRKSTEAHPHACEGVALRRQSSERYMLSADNKRCESTNAAARSERHRSRQMPECPVNRALFRSKRNALCPNRPRFKTREPYRRRPTAFGDCLSCDPANGRNASRSMRTTQMASAVRYRVRHSPRSCLSTKSKKLRFARSGGGQVSATDYRSHEAVYDLTVEEGRGPNATAEAE
jgi:hypothetical protein